MREMTKRKPNRILNHDYRQNGAYFVTFCVKDRHEILGEIVGATVPGRPNIIKLSEIGKTVDDAIMYYNENLQGVVFDRYVIMPNHIHAIVVIRHETNGEVRSPLQYIVRNLKSYVTKKTGFSLWQKSFHDHIIRDKSDYNRISEYIENNHANWENDCFSVDVNARGTNK